MWFEALTGFREDLASGSAEVAQQFVVDGEFLTSKANNRRMRFGRFETPSLNQLRDSVRNVASTTGGLLKVRQVVGDITKQHTSPTNAGALFQVASQFNTLEMVGPSVSPEQGIDRYEHDLTQGPACAIACGGGTIYRNYLVPLNGRAGQSEHNQINCLADLTAACGVDIEMRNGYAMPTETQLKHLNEILDTATPLHRDVLMGKLRIGLQWDTEVTVQNAGHAVTQAYCSALPVAYLSHPPKLWEPFARIVLGAAYEATLSAAILNAASTKNNRVFLTSLGGGAFGNDTAWIMDAIERALTMFANVDLDVAIVSYGKSDPRIQGLVDRFAS
jgi:hypothetical protein